MHLFPFKKHQSNCHGFHPAINLYSENLEVYKSIYVLIDSDQSRKYSQKNILPELAYSENILKLCFNIFN